MKRIHLAQGILLAACLGVMAGLGFCFGHNVFASLLFVGAGLVLLVLGISGLCQPRIGKMLRRSLMIAMILFVCGFAVMESFIISAGRGDFTGEPDVIIVPGAALSYDGTPGLTLETRLTAALEQLKRFPDCVIVVSGGQGADEINSEAAGMAQWLVEQGISEQRIFQEAASNDTRQNISLSFDLLESKGYDLNNTHVLIVSNDYHLFRIKLLAERRCSQVSTLGVPAVTLFSEIFNDAREVFAVVKEVCIW